MSNQIKSILIIFILFSLSKSQTITHMSPDSAYWGQYLYFEIYGQNTNFTTVYDTSMVWISNNGSDIYSRSIWQYWNSDDTLVVRFDIPFNLTTGYWNLFVQQDTTLLTLTNALYIYDAPFDPYFTRITTGEMTNDIEPSFGCSWVDFNDDGFLDMFVANGSGTGYNNTLYLNNGNGTFSRITSGIVVNDSAFSVGCSWGDYDNDSDLDLFVGNGESNFLYSNNGNGSFTKITSGNIVTDVGLTCGSSWGDYDNDGYLDLFAPAHGDVNNLLYHNNGDGTFEKITSGAIVNDGGQSNSGRWCDYNNDGYSDLFVTNYWGNTNFLYNNNGDGTFTSVHTGSIVNDTVNGVGSCWGDYDNDGDFDLFMSNGAGSGGSQNNYLYNNNGNGTFTKITQGDIVNDEFNSRGCNWVDFDNDGDLDLIVINTLWQKNLLYRNNGNGIFSTITEGYLVNDGGYSHSCSIGDYDNDGFLDIYITNQTQKNFLYKNKGNSNNWTKIKCVGQYSNYSGIGTKVKVKAQINGISVWQMRQISGSTGRSSQDALEAHFGLGNASSIETILLEWPSGFVQILENQPVNQLIEITEDSNLSIPTNFTLQTNGPIEAGVSSIDDNTFYVPSSADKVYRIDSLGIVFYTLSVNGDIKSSTTITRDQTVYIASTDYNLYSFNANGVTNPGWPIALGAQAIASVAVDDSGNTYIGTDNNIFQVIAPNGNILWSFNIAAPVYASAAISTDNTLYIVNYNGRLYAFDLDPINPSNIQYKWHFETGDHIVSSPALDDQNNIYITTLDGNLFKIYDSGTSPTLEWTYHTSDSIESSPIIGQDYTVYFGCNNSNVYAIDNTSGDSVWVYPAFGPVKSTGALTENGSLDRMYIGSNDKFLHCISLIDGSLIWIYAAFSNIECPILFQNGRIYFGTMDGRVISITDPDFTKYNKNEFLYGNIWHTFQGNNWRTGNQADIALNINKTENILPSDYLLKQNYPNPFNPVTNIKFSLPKNDYVTLNIYNILGQQVDNIVSKKLSAGNYIYTWNASNFSNGLYFYKLETSTGFVQTKKLILIK